MIESNWKDSDSSTLRDIKMHLEILTKLMVLNMRHNANVGDPKEFQRQLYEITRKLDIHFGPQ